MLYHWNRPTFSLRNLFAKITILCIVLAVFARPIKCVLSKVNWSWDYLVILFEPFKAYGYFIGYESFMSPQQYQDLCHQDVFCEFLSHMSIFFFGCSIVAVSVLFVLLLIKINHYGKYGEWK